MSVECFYRWFYLLQEKPDNPEPKKHWYNSLIQIFSHTKMTFSKNPFTVCFWSWFCLNCFCLIIYPVSEVVKRLYALSPHTHSLYTKNRINTTNKYSLLIPARRMAPDFSRLTIILLQVVNSNEPCNMVPAGLALLFALILSLHENHTHAVAILHAWACISSSASNWLYTHTILTY